MMGAPQSMPRRAISVAEYHKMIDAGVFHEDDRIELIEGELIQMAPIGGPHMQLVNLLTRILVQQVEEDGVVSPQNPVALRPEVNQSPTSQYCGRNVCGARKCQLPRMFCS